MRAALQGWEMISHLPKAELEFGNKCHNLYVYILMLGDLSLNKEKKRSNLKCN